MHLTSWINESTLRHSNAPRGLLTPFGWCITGRLGQKSSGNPLCMLISSFEDIDLGESAERV